MAHFKSYRKLFDDQFEMIQDYVKSILNELILDRGYYKKTFSALSDIEDSSYLVLLRKLPQNENDKANL